MTLNKDNHEKYKHYIVLSLEMMVNCTYVIHNHQKHISLKR